MHSWISIFAMNSKCIWKTAQNQNMKLQFNMRQWCDILNEA